MVDVSAIAGTVSAIKGAVDIAKTIVGMRDVQAVQAKVIELNAKILEAQTSAFAANRERTALIERIGDLEKQVAGFEAWEAQKQRYHLKDFGGRTFAYELKTEEARGEPAHRICPSCYEADDRSILQFRGQNAFSQDMYFCPACEETFNFGIKQPPKQPDRPSSWVRRRGG